MQSLTLEQKVGQLFFIGISGPEIDEGTRKLLDDVNPGGICLFARNIQSSQQTRNLLDSLRESLPLAPFLSVDQEGGLVDRLRRIITPMPAASKFKEAASVAEVGLIVAETLRILGFNMNFAPVVDVVTSDREVVGNGLFSRGFGRNETEVIDLAGAFFNSMWKGGVVGCLKHFPGIGAAAVDSHEELPEVNIDEGEFQNTDLAPYRSLFTTGSPEMVMVGHAAYPQLRLQEADQDGRLLPSSLSSNFVSNLLRDELKFTGIAITDDLEMGAIVRNYGMAEACKMAIGAGNDMLAICAKESAVREGFEGVLKEARSGEIDEARIDKSLERIQRLRSKLSTPLAFNSERLTELSNHISDLNARLS